MRGSVDRTELVEDREGEVVSVMDDLLAWLRDLLDETERVAQRALSPYGHWEHPGEDEGELNEVVIFPERGGDVCVATTTPTVDGHAEAAHIALHDPRAALARVAAERAILTEIASSTAQFPDFDGGHVSGLENAAMLIAWGHRFDAPGFLAEWAPERATADA